MSYKNIQNLEVISQKEMENRGYFFRPVKFVNYGYRANYQKDIEGKEETNALLSSDNWKSIKSIFRLHNETMNIWSHLGYAIYLMGCISQIFSLEVQMWHRILLFIAYTGVFLMAMMSTTYHTLKDQGSATKAIMTQLDYAGIVVLLFGLTINLVAFALHDDANSCGITLLIAMTVFISNLIVSFTNCASCCPENHHK